MTTLNVIDRDGVWVTNPHAFRFVDPETRVTFAPGVLNKVLAEKGSWVETQIDAGTLALAEPPLDEAQPPPPEPPKGGKAKGKAE
jgi:hypothetical protein